MVSQEQVLKALSYVEDPDLKKDLVTLNMIREVKISEKEIAFNLVLTTPACPMKDMIANACRNAISTMVSSSVEVKINITSEVKETLKERSVLQGVKNVIAVGAGKGGVGKSTVAIHLARTFQKAGASVGILDADIHGPSIPILLGVAEEKPKMNGDKMIPVDAHGISLMSIGFLVEANQALVWRGPMLSKAISQFCSDVEWGELDYLIVDLPPGTGDIHLSIIQQVPLSGVVLVTTPDQAAVADTLKAMEMFKNPHLKQDILGVVENMSFFEASSKKHYLFGKEGGLRFAEENELLFLGQVPIKEGNAYTIFEQEYAGIVGRLVQKLATLNASK